MHWRQLFYLDGWACFKRALFEEASIGSGRAGEEMQWGGVERRLQVLGTKRERKLANGTLRANSSSLGREVGLTNRLKNSLRDMPWRLAEEMERNMQQWAVEPCRGLHYPFPASRLGLTCGKKLCIELVVDNRQASGSSEVQEDSENHLFEHNF